MTAEACQWMGHSRDSGNPLCNENRSASTSSTVDVCRLTPTLLQEWLVILLQQYYRLRIAEHDGFQQQMQAQ